MNTSAAEVEQLKESQVILSSGQDKQEEQSENAVPAANEQYGAFVKKKLIHLLKKFFS